MRLTAAALALGGLLLAGCGNSTSGTGSTDSQPPASTTAPAAAEPGTCEYVAEGSSAGKDVGRPPATSDERPASVTLATNQGDVAITLAENAPCTTRSFAHLASSGYFDGTKCHRLTTAGIWVLQCGDPTATGQGGPGYAIPDENPTDLKPAERSGSVVYPAGTVAMANAGPNTGGSQFFLVYQDSPLPPDYAVFGTMDDAGTGVVAKVAEAGSTPEQDGKPNTEVTITTATVG
ncbi:peptidylprolyl isomerase [Actinokineospora pegani]|uniref:peptidylprolyl isomerase n=1 Tax=Actinokineospora pegani TaxID=2654637 RepID=UPI0012EA8219|nr:peptidylprolyl isomerase [Actinokineospora pegani]